MQKHVTLAAAYSTVAPTTTNIKPLPSQEAAVANISYEEVLDEEQQSQ